MNRKENITYYYYVVFSIFITLTGVFSCTHDYSIPAQLRLAESFILREPDRALNILENFNAVNELSDEGKAVYYLLLTEARDKNHVKHRSASQINMAVHYFEKHANSELKLKAFYYQGRVYEDMQHIKDAAISYKKAETVAKSSTQLRLKASIYSKLGSIYLSQHLHKNALSLYHKAYKAMLQSGDTFSGAYILRDIGRAYLMQFQSNKSLPFYRKAFLLAETYREHKSQPYNFYETALFYESRMMTDREVYYMRKSVIYNPDIINEDEAFLGLADIYRKAGLKDSAMLYLEKCLNSKNLYTKAIAYKYLSEMKEKEGHTKQAFDLYRMHTKYKDSLTNMHHPEVLTEAIAKYDANRLQNEKNQILQIKASLTGNFYLVLFVSLFLGSFSIYLFFCYRKKRDCQLKNQLNQICFYEKQIDENKRLVEAYGNEIQQKSVMLKAASIKKEELKESLTELEDDKEGILLLKRKTKQLEKSRNELKTEIETLLNKRKNIVAANNKIISQSTLIERLKVWNQGDPILSEREWNQLSDLMDEHFNNFTMRLLKKYPTLKPHDIKICSLIKLGLTNEKIAILTGCKYESVLTKRTRIKKQRMHEEEGRSLEEIINQL